MNESMYRPSAAELNIKPKDLEADLKARYAEEGTDLRDVLPQEIQERLDDYSESVKAVLEETFGMSEIPKELNAEMETVLDTIKGAVRKKGYSEEISDQNFEDLKKLAVKAMAYKQQPTEIAVKDVPEVGYKVTYTSKDGENVERPMTTDEQDMLFDMERWADQYNQLENVESFKSFFKKANEEAGKLSGDKEQKAKFLKLMYQRYEKFGFSRDEINNLLILSKSEEAFPELFPAGKQPGMHKMEIMKDVWTNYLSGEEKSRYIKLAVAIIGVGAVEGLTPVLFKYMMDANTVETATLFAAAYIAGGTGLGWIRTKLGIKFDKFINDITEREGGLNERLSRDLAFQPGEVMAATGERGRLTESMKRGKSAFKDILSNMAKSTAPAIAATATGLGMMMANDWRLGLISLASAPIMIGIAKMTEKKLEPIIDETYNVEAKTATEVQEQISAHMEIVLSGMRDSMAPRLEGLMKKFNKLANDRTVANATMDFRMGALLGPTVTAGLTVAGVALRGVGIPEAGNIVAALVYSGMFRQSFDQIMRLQTRLLESCASIMEMEEVFNGYADEETDADETRMAASELPSYSIEMRGVNLALDDRKLINNANLSIPGGGVVRLEGMSGQGKTTLMKLMTGYYRPTSGEVLIGDVPLKNIKKGGSDSIYRHVAYLSQHPYIFDTGNLRQNLAFGGHGASEEEMIQVLKELGLEERFIKNDKVNLDSSVVGVSGGESSRLGLARVLLKIRAQENGGIVFLDQPTEELDEETEEKIAEILVLEKKKRPDVTFVVISHRPSFIAALEKTRGDEPGLEIQRIKIHRGSIAEK